MTISILFNITILFIILLFIKINDNNKNLINESLVDSEVIDTANQMNGIAYQILNNTDITFNGQTVNFGLPNGYLYIIQYNNKLYDGYGQPITVNGTQISANIIDNTSIRVKPSNTVLYVSKLN